MSICSIDCKRDCRDDYVFENETVKHCIVFLISHLANPGVARLYIAHIYGRDGLSVRSMSHLFLQLHT